MAEVLMKIRFRDCDHCENCWLPTCCACGKRIKRFFPRRRKK